MSDSSNSDTDSPLEDSDEEYGTGNERTPLLRGHAGGGGASDSDDQMEDTRFIETVAESQITRPGSRTRGNNSQGGSGSTVTTARLIDISSDSEQISDDSFGSFQSATDEKSGAMLLDANADCNLSLKSAKSYDSDKTFVADDNVVVHSGNDRINQPTRPQKLSSIKKNDESNATFGSSTSFFSCLESELEKSTSSSNINNELFQSFSS